MKRATRHVALLLATTLVALLVACSAPAAPATQHGAAPDVAPEPTTEIGAAPSAPPVRTLTPDSVAAAGEAGSATESQTQSTAPAPTVTVPAPPVTATPTVRPNARKVALDPGHGGAEIGAAAAGLAEKDINLRIALKLAELLRERDVDVVLTRDSDRTVSPEYMGGGYPGVGRDLQARVDTANAAKADLFLSIHNNGSNDPGISGTEVWYSGQREFGEENRRLARLAQAALVKSIRALDYPVVDRGIKDDSNFRMFQGRVYNIYVLGPGTGARPHVATAMPGILGETLFLSNVRDAAMLRQERTLEAIAAGYRDAIVAYFAGER